MSKALKGTLQTNTNSSSYNAQSYLMKQNILGINTAEIVQVIAVNSDKTLDVRPLLASLGGDETAVNTSIIFNVPFLRRLGGSNGLIIDPQVNDIGLIVYCQRDISSLKANARLSVPPTKRAFNPADGIYVCSIASLNGQPRRFIEVSDNGIMITGDGPVTVNTTEMTINGNVKINGRVTATDDIISGSISTQTHMHGGVTAGNSTTGVPQ